VGAIALVLSACTSFTSERLATSKAMSPKGGAFNTALHKEYLEEAVLEVTEKDYGNAEVWIDKANAAAGGGEVLPEDPGGWKLPAGTVGDISAARGRLMAAFGKGARDIIPGQAAFAQRELDCWIEEQSENIQPPDIAACRAEFEQAMAKIDDALKPKPVAAPAPPPPPPPEPKPVERTIMDAFIIYFAFDDSEISAEGRTVIARAVEAVQGAKKYVLTVRGHTDRAGANSYNANLAEARADNVAMALMDSGILSNKVRLRYFGEDSNAVATADGAREPFNRRVEINIDRTVVVMMK
jgi:OOP family OmpA-OmpF porin